MHGICRLSCQKSKRIPLVAALCVLLESAAKSTSRCGIFRCSSFFFAYKNIIVVVGTLVNLAVWDTLMYELIVNTTPKKILYYSVTVLILWSSQRLPVRHHLPCENFHVFYKVILLDFDEIIKGRIATETSRPTITFAIRNLQVVVVFCVVHIALNIL